MAIRVVARIRPHQTNELEKDIIVSATSAEGSAPSQPTLVKIPSPKNENEDFTFQFSSVYDGLATQQSIFDNEVSPTIKHLFNGLDVTIFAYGSTGTGKTHTMRGGKTLAERGVIPRLLSAIYRRGRKIEKDTAGQSVVEIALSYYEIYNDKVFDLFEAPEKRTMAGLPLRDSNGKTVIVGLTERPCESLKDFEKLYDQANANRSTGATKLNATSSRSHAILSIKLTITTEDQIRISTASAIDLAGSEDNRRTDNGKERLVESASINKSLFVLAKCVEALHQEKPTRVPYRESKMTRILSLGQNNGLTVMILNLAPVKSFHLDTLSSLNFANRTKRIEVREIENEPIFKGCTRALPSIKGDSMQRQPLRPIASTLHNAGLNVSNVSSKQAGRPSKAFSVFSDNSRQSDSLDRHARNELLRRSSPLKRPSDAYSSSVAHPPKRRSPNRITRPQSVISRETIEDIIERKVSDILASRALDQTPSAPVPEISEEVQRRLEKLEQKIEGKDDGREQGLTFLLMAKQHSVRGEDLSALKMYTLAKDYFPNNGKLDLKIDRLQLKLKEKRDTENQHTTKLHSNEKTTVSAQEEPSNSYVGQDLAKSSTDLDEEYHDALEPISEADCETADSFQQPSRSKKPIKQSRVKKSVPVYSDDDRTDEYQTPRTKELLNIINTRDIAQIRLLRGVGAKKAEAILEALCAGDDDVNGRGRRVTSLGQLGGFKGVGAKSVGTMRLGLDVPP